MYGERKYSEESHKFVIGVPPICIASGWKLGWSGLIWKLTEAKVQVVMIIKTSANADAAFPPCACEITCHKLNNIPRTAPLLQFIFVSQILFNLH